MMVAVFATMTGAHLRLVQAPIAGHRAVRRLLDWSVGLFLFEIYSPEYGFRMPGIHTEFDRRSQVQS